MEPGVALVLCDGSRPLAMARLADDVGPHDFARLTVAQAWELAVQLVEQANSISRAEPLAVRVPGLNLVEIDRSVPSLLSPSEARQFASQLVAAARAAAPRAARK